MLASQFTLFLLYGAYLNLSKYNTVVSELQGHAAPVSGYQNIREHNAVQKRNMLKAATYFEAMMSHMESNLFPDAPRTYSREYRLYVFIYTFLAIYLAPL